MPQNSPAGNWERKPCQPRLPLPVATRQGFPPSQLPSFASDQIAWLSFPAHIVVYHSLDVSVCLSLSAPASLFVILYTCLSVWRGGHPTSLGLPAAPVVVWVSGWLGAEGRGLTLPLLRPPISGMTPAAAQSC